MEKQFATLDEFLAQRGISLKRYSDFLHKEESFGELTYFLKQKAIALPEFRKYLDYLYSPTRLLKPKTLEDSFSGDEKALQVLGNQLLHDAKVSLRELNALLEENTGSRIEPRILLHKLVQQRKLLIEDFLGYDQILKKISPQERADWGGSYLLEKQEGHYTFSLAKTEGRQQYGHYQVLGEIARGGMGIVYKAYHTGLNQKVALKVLLAGEQAREATLKRFHREVQLTAKLKHPAIVSIVDSGQEGAEHYFVMEYIEGKSLQAHLAQGIPLRQGVEWIQHLK
jgi:hypothetical protein